MRRSSYRRQLAAFGAVQSWLGFVIAGISVFAGVLRIGVWSDAEPMGVAFLIGAGLTWLGLGFLAGATPAARRALQHPFVVVCLLLGIWSGVVSIASARPVLSLLGAPQNLQGALWWFALAGFSAAVMILRISRLWIMSLALVIGLGALAAAALSATDLPLRLLSFPEYLAFSAMGLAAGAGALFVIRRRRLAAILAVSAVVALVLSQNKTAYVVAAILALIWIASLQPRLAWIGRRKPLGPMTVAVLVTLVAIAPYFFTHIAHLTNAASTLWSRSILFQAVDPLRGRSWADWLLGRGWGDFSEQLVRRVPESGVRLYSSEWTGLQRDLFHSHNAALESLFAAGVPGLLLTLAMPVALVCAARRSLRPIALAFGFAWTVLDSLWFEMPVTLVACTLGAGLIADSAVRIRVPLLKLTAPIAGLALAALFGGSAWALATFALEMDQLARCVHGAAPPATCLGRPLPVDPRGTDYGLALLIGEAVNKLSSNDESHRLLAKMMNGAEGRLSSDHGSANLAMALANADATLAFRNGGAWDPALAVTWPNHIDLLLQRAPERVDALGPYLNWLLLNDREDELRAVLLKAEAVSPDHPVILWFAGAVELNAPDPDRQARAIALMRRALQDGVDRYIPIEAGIAARLLSPSS